MPDASPGSWVLAPEQLVHPELELSCLSEPETASPGGSGTHRSKHPLCRGNKRLGLRESITEMEKLKEVCLA